MPQLPPTVCLDSAAVRRIREDSKLTQLYVSKIVGVTTDTISRWENNRYPTVKRENALRLAEALEVGVEAILQRDEGIVGATVGPLPAPLAPRTVVFWLLLLLLLGGGATLLWRFLGPSPVPPSSLFTERWLPRYAAPGSLVPMWIHFDPDTDNKGFILRERFPPGWTLVEASPVPASLDNVQGVARWIVKPGEPLTVVSCLLRVDEAAEPGTLAIHSGEVVVGSDERSQPISVKGAAQIELAPFHWADSNGDLQVDDGEMLAASDTFTVMQGIPLDWNALEKIWDAGSYRWDQASGTFIPVKPPVSATGSLVQ